MSIDSATQAYSHTSAGPAPHSVGLRSTPSESHALASTKAHSKNSALAQSELPAQESVAFQNARRISLLQPPSAPPEKAILDHNKERQQHAGQPRRHPMSLLLSDDAIQSELSKSSVFAASAGSSDSAASRKPPSLYYQIIQQIYHCNNSIEQSADSSPTIPYQSNGHAPPGVANAPAPRAVEFAPTAVEFAPLGVHEPSAPLGVEFAQIGVERAPIGVESAPIGVDSAPIGVENHRPPNLLPSTIKFDALQSPVDSLELATELIDPGLDLPAAPWPHDGGSWMQSIEAALPWVPPPMARPPFRFVLSDEAAAFNMAILTAAEMNIERVLFGDRQLPTCPGSNFRPVELLDPVFQGHPHWPRVRSYLLFGAAFPLKALDPETRQSELSQMIEYGNHKSATKARQQVLATLEEETAKAWHLPLPIQALHQLPNTAIAPFGFVEQLKLQADGSRKLSGRITHDQTFEFSRDASVNNRVRVDELNPVKYGFTLQRLLHRLIASRSKYPTKAIYLPKYDWKSAYKNLHFALETMLQSATTTKGITPSSTLALLALRATFGGVPCPAIFSDVSEMCTDAANELVRDHAWDPSILASRFSEYISTTPEPYPVDNTPFALARQMTVTDLIPIDEDANFDVFLDNHLAHIVHTSDDAVCRGVHAIPLILDLMGRPVRSDEPLPRDALLAISKLIAEGRLTEIQVVLGWQIDTRRLLISLPADKHQMYYEDTAALALQERRLVTKKTLETLYGRLIFVATAIKPMLHCLGQIHSALSRASAAPKRRTRLSKLERQDLGNCLRYLDVAKAGVDINLLVSRVPDFVIPTDACLHQIGGHDMDAGFGWRLPVPVGAPPHQINLLEFIGPVCGTWLAVSTGQLRRGDCVLAIGDNTTAAGWLRRSNFSDESSSPQTLLLARLFAEICLQMDLCCYSQWRMGLDNPVPDLISRSPDFSGTTTAQRDFLGALLSSAAESEWFGVTLSTHNREDMAWNRWMLYLERTGGKNDPFLLQASEQRRLLLFVGFIESVRTNHYSKSNKGNPFLVAGTVQSTINGVAKAFKAQGHPDPRKNAQGDTHLLIDRLLKGYKNLDPSTKHQMALPMSLIKKLLHSKSTSRGFRHFTRLGGVAVFFAMRSCEYLKVHHGDKTERRTLPLRLCDITFWKDGKILPHNSPYLHQADSVSLLFRFQKNDGRDEVVTMASSGHYLACPVVLLAKIVKSLLQLVARGMIKEDAELYHYLNDNDKVAVVNTKMALEFLRHFVRGNKPEELGLSIDRVGLHSLRATAAMAMYMSKVPVFTIMLIGRWRSLAFLSYIRKQVEQFTAGVSAQMLTVDHFRTVQVNRRQGSSIPDLTEERSLDALASGTIPLMGTSVVGPEAFDIWRG